MKVFTIKMKQLLCPVYQLSKWYPTLLVDFSWSFIMLRWKSSNIPKREFNWSSMTADWTRQKDSLSMSTFCLWCRWYLCIVLPSLQTCKAEHSTKPASHWWEVVFICNRWISRHMAEFWSEGLIWEAPKISQYAVDICSSRDQYGDWWWSTHSCNIR